MSIAMDARPPAGKYRTALILVFVAVAFFSGVIIRHWLW
jgi:hypothetical protein